MSRRVLTVERYKEIEQLLAGYGVEPQTGGNPGASGSRPCQGHGLEFELFPPSGSAAADAKRKVECRGGLKRTPHGGS